MRTLSRSGTKLELKLLERAEDPLLDAYQVRFGCVPTCVGLPETQRSIGINNAKL